MAFLHSSKLIKLLLENTHLWDWVYLFVSYLYATLIQDTYLLEAPLTMPFTPFAPIQHLLLPSLYKASYNVQFLNPTDSKAFLRCGSMEILNGIKTHLEELSICTISF